MKKLLLFVFILMFAMMCISCEDKDYKEDIVLELAGDWYITADSTNEGEIEFTKDEEFSMTTPYGDVEYGNYSLSTETDELTIVYGVNSDGEEIMTDDDYENGWYCKILTFGKDDVHILNLPYYRNKTVKLTRK